MIRSAAVLAASLFTINSLGCARDPVASYKDFVESEFARAASAHPGFEPANVYEIDVRKSDSLVSPLVGTAVTTATWPGTKSYSVTASVKMTHNFQDSRWVFAEGKATIQSFKVDGGDRSEDRKAVQAGLDEFVGTSFPFQSLDRLPGDSRRVFDATVGVLEMIQRNQSRAKPTRSHAAVVGDDF